MIRYLLPLAFVVLLPITAGAQGLLPTHRIPAELAGQAVAEAVASCAKQGYAETAGTGRCGWRAAGCAAW